ncbi:MAG: 6-phosphogluconolactonase [Alphaproteobacteria bacterium]|nr:6-phosphogluconolactonase [Alphaproteobacteria bacterium]
MTPLRIFASGDELGTYAAAEVWRRLEAAQAERGVATLGCPSGRSPMSTYAALAAQALRVRVDGARLHVVMMDEYLVTDGGRERLPPRAAHFSCAGFGERHILAPLNATLAAPVPAENLHVPPADDPAAYEEVIAGLGGIDMFLLASGASDGHVAFNPPGTPRAATTRRVELAEATRRDNLGTFPAFRSLDEVPRFGVSVGPETIARHAGAALLLMIGAAKRPSLERIRAARSYDAAWPATIVHDCANAAILADRAAAGGQAASG